MPAAVVEYRRRRFICPFTLSRICLDSGIGLGRINERLLPRLGTVEVGTIVLEVKDGGPAQHPLAGDAPRRRDQAAELFQIRGLHRQSAQGGMIVFDQFQKIKDVQDLTARIDPWLFGIAILVSLGASLAASWLYSRYYERRGTGSQINRAFPLLGISITALFICIQVSLPLSLGLLGALSIIRFRTPVKEPEEVGFIMLVIAASIICATFNFQFLLFLYLVAVAALWGISRVRRVSRAGRDGIILVTLGDEEARQLARRRSRSASGATPGAASSRAPSARKGWQACSSPSSTSRAAWPTSKPSCKRLAPVNSVQIFFNRPGGLS